ncbi:MAG: tRNA 2-thiocytidine biosynthesis protein TtcA [Lachnospiraceae bacterium]|jgi:tRNA 2-thiocytidine biosynthesis protein TtcA|nr:tRNA 2-thiocytidine biosynthesis protein TtcA [Lachnospiraceae bacterium]
MKLQRLLSLTRQAIDAYHMIAQNDHIALGISGGKDSLTLLYALGNLRNFYPNHFKISAITVDLGFGNMDLEPIRSLCHNFSVPYQIISTNIGPILFESRNESNPCSLCAKMRKGALNRAAKEMGCNKIAYAHHRDDVIETMLLSMLYEGRFYSFSPCTYLDRMDLTLIRPLIFVTEAEVIGFRNKYQLPVCKNPCPVDGHTKREYVKKLSKQLEFENPGAKNRMFRAIIDGNIKGWPDPNSMKLP